MASAGYALGVFRRPAAAPSPGQVPFRGHAPGASSGDGYGPEFTGLVVGDRVRDVSGLGPVNDLLGHRDDAQRRLDELAAAPCTGDWADLAGLGDHGGQRRLPAAARPAPARR